MNKMLCENSYYPNDNNNEKPNCRKMDDNYFKGKCPLIYYCTINERFEQTTDMFGCKYRSEKNDR